MPKAVEEDLEQGHLPDMEPPRIPALDRAAKDYVKKRDARMAMLKEENEAKEKLAELMKEHELGTYTTRDGRVVDVTEIEKIKVKSPENDEDDD